MGTMRTLNRSFAGGEISPEMYGRIDDAKYQAGAALLSNFIATPQGPAENRPGFAYVNSTKNNGAARLIPFTYSSDQTMVIEVGPGYFRFHTQGETLVYSPTQPAWVSPSTDISLSLSTPTVVNWTTHGLSSGDPIAFYLFGGTQLSELPSGLQVGYVYTVQVIDANNFNLIDNGVLVGFPAPSSGGGATTYTGSGGTSVRASAASLDGDDEISSTLTGLSSAVVSGGFANLTVTISASIQKGFGGSCFASFQYSTGSGWKEFYFSDVAFSGSITVQIPISNANQLSLQVEASCIAGSKGGASASGAISAWSLTVAGGGGGGATAFTGVRAYKYYGAGDIASYSGANYSAVVAFRGGQVTPGTDETVWHHLPSSQLVYEVANSYSVDDIFDIHYVQSADVLTLVHPNYPPSELRRMGATAWSFSPVLFGQQVDSPAGVAIVASPGFLAQIASVSGTPSTFTTVSNHTLALGDGVYASNLIIGGQAVSDFFLVAEVPVDGTGALIPNKLQLMDYSGNMVTATLGTSPTLQFGDKIFDITNYYVVTALSPDGVNQSPISMEASALNNLNVSGSYNTISWSAVSGAGPYYIYKKKNGLYGFIGQTDDTTFSDNNIAPDFSITPPTFDPVFNAAGAYPGAVSYFDQRRCFAGTLDEPQSVQMSRSGTESDFSYSLPVTDTDRVSFRVASREASTVRHIIPLTQLILLTSSAELVVFAANSDVITPSNVGVRPQSYIGASNVQPSVINNSLVYCAARGGHIREMGYQWTANGFVTGDLSLRAANLFDNLTIVDQCFAKCSRSIVWFVSSNGKLLGLTYVPEEQIGAWHEHTTDGIFESITAVAEGNEDRLYAVIRRTINGSTVRFVERMASRIIDENDVSTWFFVDAGSTYNGSPATTISGLTWLEGETVSILADGAVQPQQVVTGGSITLAHAASIVQVGLPYACDLQTLPLTLQIDGYGQGRQKNINKVWVRVWKSSGVFAGPDVDHLTEYKQRTDEVYGTPPALKSDELDIVIGPSWQASGQIVVHGEDPLPLSVVGITMQVAIGG